MKSKVQWEKILFYGVNEQENPGKKICERLEQMGIPWRQIPQEALNHKVGEFAGILPEQDLPAFEGEAFGEPVMILHGLEKSRFNRLLNRLDEDGVQILKAVVTTTNKDWEFFRLFEEIAKERQQMRLAKERAGKAAKE